MMGTASPRQSQKLLVEAEGPANIEKGALRIGGYWLLSNLYGLLGAVPSEGTESNSKRYVSAKLSRGPPGHILEQSPVILVFFGVRLGPEKAIHV